MRTIPKGFERSRTGTDILAAVERAKLRDLDSLPPLERSRSNNANGALIQLMKVLLQSVAERSKVAARLIANSDDIEKIALDDAADVLALQGWRREIYGDLALRLKRGEITIGIDKGRIVAVPKVNTESEILAD